MKSHLEKIVAGRWDSSALG